MRRDQRDHFRHQERPARAGKSGSGDVLARILAGFITQGVDTFHAAAMAAGIRGEAGRRIGAGLIAEDLEAQLPDIVSALHGERAG